jgi:hypothetical protein
MLVFFAPDRILCTPSYAAIAKHELALISEHCGKPIQTTAEEVGSVYPSDILLNALPIGGYLLCNVEHTARELTELSCCKPLRVRQGYSKCAAIPVGDRALITSDPSIARAARASRLEVLQISCGHITLEGYDTGLIGGTASFAPYGGTDEILFCGDLALHPDAEAITAFCRSRKRHPISLCNGRLTDVGTLFLV